MIIRRRHTANFTTIGNALFEDERLAADEVGILSYLRSRPDDWEVRRPALMRRWGIGRDALRRILHNLIRTGWIVARATRLSNGTVHMIYEVQDEPGPELSEAQLREAFAPAGAAAFADAETAEVEEAAEAAEAGETADRPEAIPPGTGQPHTGQPHTGQPDAGQPDTGQPDTANPYPAIYKTLPKTDSPKTESTKTESTKAGRAFFDVRKAWPAEHVLSYPVCEGLHAHLGERDREAAFQGIRPYLDDCRARNRKLCDLATYYRERRWERFAARKAVQESYEVRRGTPQAERWRAYFAAHEPGRLAFFELRMREGAPYCTRSEWPPGQGAPATGPPSAASRLCLPASSRTKPLDDEAGVRDAAGKTPLASAADLDHFAETG